MRRAILAGNQKTPTSSRKRRDQRHSLSAQVRRLRLEQLVAREMLSADGFTLATMTSNTDIFDPAILEGDVVVKTKAPNGGEVTPAVPIEVDQWLMVWNPDQGPGASYGPSVVTSIEANDLIENSHVIKFQQAFTADQAVEHLGLGGTPEMTYPLIATNLAERLIPTDPDFFMQFHLRNTGQYGGAGGQDINVVNAWDSYLGDGVVIGVVDDGVDYNHPDLLGNYRADLSFDYAFGDSDPAPDTSVNWHGTAVAGVAAALHNNAVFGRGTTGVAPQADIAGIRLTAAATTDATNAAAINHQMGDVDIYVNSWGPLDIGNIAAAGQPGPLARAALENGAQNGRGGLGSVLIWAAGNGHASSDNVNYDLYANSRHTIAVGAMTHTGVETNYSERGSALFVVAPSTGAGTALAVATTDIFGPLGYTTANFTDPSETTTTRFTGTSAAAPQVAGVVALMLEANPSLTARDVQHILAESARRNDTGDADWFQNAAGHWVNPKFGFGVVDATAATTLAETWTPVSDELAWNSTVLEPALSIPDNDLTGTNVTFGVPDNFQVEHVEVQIDADHTYGGDLVITLTSPNGTASRLTEVHNQVGTYTFDHTLTTNRNWNEDTFGDWTLTVADGFAADTGTLERAAIKVYGHVIDTALPNLTSTNVTANEADGTIDFEIMLEAAQAEDVTFEAVTFDGTAIDGSDYTGLDFEPFTIPAGETSIVISVPLIQDGVEEIAKTFSLGLTNFVGSDPLVRAAVGTIVDDDDPPFYVATPQTMISPIAAMIAESNGNEILLISDTDVDDMRFEAVDGTLASALVTPANEDVTITAQFVDPNGDPVGSSVSSATPGAAVVLPLTAMAGNGAHAVRVIGDTSSDVVIDLMFGAVNEGFGDDTGGGSSAMLEGSLVALGSGRYAAVGELTVDAAGITVSQTNDPAAFIDISGTGTALAIEDDFNANENVNFTSTIGNELLPAGTMRVNNNGNLIAGSTGNLSWNNGSIPTTAVTNFLAPFWDDLDPRGNFVYHEETTIDGVDALIVQWNTMPHWNIADGEVTFQIQLFDSGPVKAKFVYPDVDFGNTGLSFAQSATIGYQIDVLDFFQFSRNQAVLANNDVLTFQSSIDVDEYTVDLTGKVGSNVDVLLTGLEGSDLTGVTAELVAPDGTTVLAASSATPGGFAPTNYDLGIVGFEVPADGVYTVRITSEVSAKYSLVVTEGMAFETETNDAPTDPLRALGLTAAGLGHADAAGDAMEHYTVELEVDDYVIFETSTPFDSGSLDLTNTLDPDLTLFDPSDSLLWSEDNTADDGKNVFKYFRALEAGTYTLALSAVSGDGVYVLDVNEWVNRDPDDIDLAPLSIEENAGDNILVGTFSTSDVDPGDTHEYSLVSGAGDSGNAAFSIVDDTLVANSSLDFETQDSYSVRVRTTDQRGGLYEEVFTIDVLDINDVPTDIAVTPAAIAENAGVDALVGLLSTTDQDAGDTFTYALVSGDGDDDNASFSISGDELIAGPSFDFETKNSYTVRVMSTDAGGLSVEKAITIDVTDVNEVPTDLALSPTAIEENAGVDAAVGTFLTTDVDAGETFTYSLVAGAGDDDNAAFNISGDVLQANDSFNFEVKDSYMVRVMTTDSGGLTFEKSFVIDVTDINDAPSDLDLSPASLDENAGVDAVVGTLTTADEDAGDTSTYSLVSGAGDDDNAAFNISGAELRANADFDFETKDSYTVRVMTTDAGGLTLEKSFVIDVNDVNDAPTDINISATSIAENAGVDAVIGTLSTVDQDAGDSFTYALVSGSGDDDNGAFNISGDELRANASFDFETQDSYTIRVMSTDAAGETVEKILLITVDNRGELETVTIGDGTSQRSLVTSVTVTFDSEVTLGPDAFEVMKRGAGGGAVGVIVDSIVDGDGRTVVTLTFSGGFVDPATGSLLDGNYDLRIVGANITDGTGLGLDLDEDGTEGGDHVIGDEEADRFYRFFGDGNGNREVDIFDFLAFRGTFDKSEGDAGYDARFDATGDGNVGIFDFLQFRNRFGNSLDFE